ncbi:MAG: cobalamin B12-binding protein [Nocardioides sp.]|jgi:methylmalonyl-CoA mutase C-terminal domain/subunit|nr:cobalamin B12-binding protein [Nocardioides sp.]
MATTDPVRRLRVVVDGPGPDGADPVRDAVARGLRDAGHEVIWTGLHQLPEQLVETALQEDADLVALPGADDDFVGRVVDRLAERDASDIEVGAPGATAGDVLGWVSGRLAAGQA